MWAERVAAVGEDVAFFNEGVVVGGLEVAEVAF